MEKKNLYVIVAIVLIAGLALSFYSNFTGQSTLGTEKGKCTDTDGGKNKEVKGTVSYTGRAYSYTDYCFSRGKGPGKYLKEYFCLSGIESQDFLCDNTCIDGACVK